MSSKFGQRLVMESKIKSNSNIVDTQPKQLVVTHLSVSIDFFKLVNDTFNGDKRARNHFFPFLVTIFKWLHNITILICYILHIKHRMRVS